MAEGGKEPWETWTDEDWEAFCERTLKDEDTLTAVMGRLNQVRLDEKPGQNEIIIDKRRPYLYGITVENHPKLPDDWKLCKIGYTD